MAVKKPGYKKVAAFFSQFVKQPQTCDFYEFLRMAYIVEAFPCKRLAKNSEQA